MAETNSKDDGPQAVESETGKVMTFDTEEGVSLLPTLGRQSGTACVSQGLLGVSESAISHGSSFRTYKRRWLGLIAILVLNLLNSISWIWAAAIAPAVSTYYGGLPLSAINWLSNIVNVLFLPSCLFVPYLATRLSMRHLMMISAGLTVLAGWLRYASTAPLGGWSRRYIFLILAQALIGLAQPIGLVIGPKYSEAWFDENGRMVATMIVSIGAPLGGAIGQLITPLLAPSPDKVPFCILVIAIFTTAASMVVFLVGDRPPTPPSHAASLSTPPFSESIRLLLNSTHSSTFSAQVMTLRERIDLWIIIFAFGILVGVFSTLATYVNQIFTPYGYSANAAGNMGAGLIGAGLVAAAIFSPLFDKVLKTRLALAVKVILPVVSASFIALIWELKSDNTIVIVVLLIFIGSGMFILLPVALELAVEVSRSPDPSSALLWFSGNVFSVIFILVLDSLRADGVDGWGPQGNLRRGVVFLSAWVAAAAIAAFAIDGRQIRRKIDEERRVSGVVCS